MNGRLGDVPVCVLNPAAGGGVDRPWLESALARVLGDGRVRVAATQQAGDAERLALEAVRDGATALIAAGGDGTLHGVVNGLALADGEVPVGVLPLGTANDFVRSAGLPGDIASAIAGLARAEVRPVDLIRVELEPGADGSRTRIAVNACTGGVSGAVTLGAGPANKGRWGQLAYAKAAFDLLTGAPRPYEARARFDDLSLEGPFLVVVVANGGRAGGGIPVAPGAEVDDRRLDAVIIRDAPLSTVLAQLPRLATGSEEGTEGTAGSDRGKDPAVLHRQVRSVEVEATSQPMPWSLDGEPIEAHRVRFLLEPDRLSLLVPDAPGAP